MINEIQELIEDAEKKLNHFDKEINLRNTRNIMGGKSEAGIFEKEKNKEEKIKEESLKLLERTGLNPFS